MTNFRWPLGKIFKSRHAVCLSDSEYAKHFPSHIAFQWSDVSSGGSVAGPSSVDWETAFDGIDAAGFGAAAGADATEMTGAVCAGEAGEAGSVELQPTERSAITAAFRMPGILQDWRSPATCLLGCGFDRYDGGGLALVVPGAKEAAWGRSAASRPGPASLCDG